MGKPMKLHLHKENPHVSEDADGQRLVETNVSKTTQPPRWWRWPTIESGLRSRDTLPRFSAATAGPL